MANESKHDTAETNELPSGVQGGFDIQQFDEASFDQLTIGSPYENETKH